MQPDLQLILAYTVLPTLAILVGGSIAVFRVPDPQTSSIVQHLAAGVVFAAVATELVPEMTREQRLTPLIAGFVCGVGAMLSVKWLVARLNPEPDRASQRRATLRQRGN